MNYGDRIGGGTANSAYQAFAPFSLDPIWNAQGQPQIGVFDDGRPTRCVSTAHGPRCVVVIWPGSWFAYTRPRFRASFWHGTMLEDKQDFAGTHYRRNRNYDPQTGRFTQEDPIGLAGGMNLYGFAGDDPVSMSDPFGLWDCDKDKPCPNTLKELADRMSAAATDLAVKALDVVTDFLDAVIPVKSMATVFGLNPATTAQDRALAGVAAVGSLGDVGPGLARGIAKTIKGAQGAEVSFSRVGNFVRGTWEVGGDKGAGYVRWNKVLNQEGGTVRLFKDVYNQGGNFLRRDWYIPELR
jgi:RHS repeat-associated protein